MIELITIAFLVGGLAAAIIFLVVKNQEAATASATRQKSDDEWEAKMEAARKAYFRKRRDKNRDQENPEA